METIDATHTLDDDTAGALREAVRAFAAGWEA